MSSRAVLIFATLLGACASTPPPPPKRPAPVPEQPASEPPWTPPPKVVPSGPPLIVEVVDVGQGDGIIIRSPTDKVVMLDAGDKPGWKPMLAQLEADGIDELDLAIISHPHADHIGGMEKVLEKVPAKMVLDPGFDYASGIYTSLLELLQRTKTPIVIARAGRTIDIGGGATIEVLAPSEPLHVGTRSDANSNSVVFKLTYGRTSMLFTGDAEAPTEQRLLDEGSLGLASDVLKVAHHGSQHSTTDAFLAAVDPDIAVISCGVGNKFKHPGESTIAKLEMAGVEILRTDLLGTIKLKSDGVRWTHSSAGKEPVTIDDTPVHTRDLALSPATP